MRGAMHRGLTRLALRAMLQQKYRCVPIPTSASRAYLIGDRNHDVNALATELDDVVRYCSDIIVEDFSVGHSASYPGSVLVAGAPPHTHDLVRGLLLESFVDVRTGDPGAVAAFSRILMLDLSPEDPIVRRYHFVWYCLQALMAELLSVRRFDNWAVYGYACLRASQHAPSDYRKYDSDPEIRSLLRDTQLDVRAIVECDGLRDLGHPDAMRIAGALVRHVFENRTELAGVWNYILRVAATSAVEDKWNEVFVDLANRAGWQC